MCGICGFAGFDNPDLLKRMCNVMQHRGPDDSGYYIGKDVSLGHRRLSIIDLNTGRQPIHNEDESIWIIYNGEIYNFKELRKELEQRGHRFYTDTDTEVIVHAYEEYGHRCLKHFNGMFAFALYDDSEKSLFLARDRIGEKPLYYYFKNEKFIFASEIKAILNYNGVKRRVNVRALKNFIELRYIPGAETIFHDIYKLFPGYYMTFNLKDKGLLLTKYWDLNISDKKIMRASRKFFVKKLLDLFEDSIEKRLISDVPLGVYLSGGIDSSAVVAMMHHINTKNKITETIKTFSIGFGYSEESDELKHAKLVSEFFNTEHKEFIVKSDLVKLLPRIIWHLDEPMGDPALIPVFLLSENAKKKVTVILTGDGGDELFAGYEHYKFLLLNEKIKNVPLARYLISPLVKAVPTYILDKIFKYTSALGEEGFKRFEKMLLSADNRVKSYLEVISIFDEEEIKNLFIEMVNIRSVFEDYFDDGRNHLNQLLYAEIKTVLPENFLMKIDKMTMAHAVEARPPFLDHRLVELSFRIPPQLKLNYFKEKYILKKAMNNFLPDEIIKRKKQRFYVPIDLWIRDELRPFVEELLSEKNIERQGYFRFEYVQKILKNFDKSRLFYSRQLWNLLTFEIWHRIFIENIRPEKVLEV